MSSELLRLERYDLDYGDDRKPVLDDSVHKHSSNESREGAAASTFSNFPPAFHEQALPLSTDGLKIFYLYVCTTPWVDMSNQEVRRCLDSVRVSTRSVSIRPSGNGGQGCPAFT